jgi:two-component system copper resistance phosphate regulon response regulator CusR
VRLLVVEDYEPLRKSLVRGLADAGYAVDSAADGSTGLALARSVDYDVLILDVMLPDVDGFTILKSIHRADSRVRVILLTARDQLEDKIRGLDLGADDYLVKPFAFEELLARLRALVRRRYGKDATVKIGDLEIDTTARIVRVGRDVVDLTAREYSILEVLALRAGEIVTRQEIAEHIYDWAREVGSNVVDVYIGYLRRKLRDAGATSVIRTHRGIGYALEAPR